MKTGTNPRRYKIPQAESPGEASFALFCFIHKLEPVREYRFAPARKWRFDFAFPEHMLAVEVEGGVHRAGRHSRGAGMEADMEKYNHASKMGWKVLRYSTEMVLRGVAIEDVLDIIGR